MMWLGFEDCEEGFAIREKRRYGGKGGVVSGASDHKLSLKIGRCSAQQRQIFSQVPKLSNFFEILLYINHTFFV